MECWKSFFLVISSKTSKYFLSSSSRSLILGFSIKALDPFLYCSIKYLETFVKVFDIAEVCGVFGAVVSEVVVVEAYIDDFPTFSFKDCDGPLLFLSFLQDKIKLIIITKKIFNIFSSSFIGSVI